MTEGEAEAGVSPYASGGGGTVLEHLYGAILPQKHSRCMIPYLEAGLQDLVYRGRATERDSLPRTVTAGIGVGAGRTGVAPPHVEAARRTPIYAPPRLACL
jgi:hypothetical protein